MNEATCNTEGCDKPIKVKKRGLCHNHYYQWALVNKPRVGTTECAVEDCDSIVYARTYCRKHYGKLLAYGDPVWEYQSKNQGNCECGSPVHSRGLCRACYQREWYANRAVGPVQARKSNPTHPAMHYRISGERGKASEYTCVDCGHQAQEWSLMASAEIIKDYKGRLLSLNVMDYEPRCSNCHKAYDATHGVRRYKSGRYAKNPGGLAC